MQEIAEKGKKQLHRHKRDNEADFLGFLLKLVPLHYLSSRSDFGFEFEEIFVIEKGLPDSASRQLSDLASRGVAESLTLRLGESLLNT
jgi:hypothetical protein